MSTLKVDNINEYTGGGGLTISGSSVTINGYTPTNATTASYVAGANVDGAVALADNLTAGDKDLSGTIDQQFTAPGGFQQKNFATVSGATVNSDSYTNVFYGVADYSAFGQNFADYFTIEYYDGFGYNFGSEFNVNGIQTRLSTFASGSGAGAEVKTTDNGDTTSKVTLRSDSGQILVTTLGNYADDTAAASGGVPVNGMYRSGSQLMIRVS